MKLWLNLLKSHLKRIKFSFIFVIIFTISCNNSYYRKKLSIYASDGIFNVEDDDVCYDEVRQFFFVKHCDSLYYSNVVLSEDVRNKDKIFNLRRYGVMFLENPDHFFEADFIVNNPELERSTIWFNKYPDSVFVAYDTIINRSVCERK